MNSDEKFLALRPLNVKLKFKDDPVGLVSGRVICEVMKKKHAITMAANIRNPLSAFGIMKAAKEMDATFLLELAKSENGYTTVRYDNLPEMVSQFSKELGGGIVFGLHMDHYAVKNAEERDEAVVTIPKAISMGWTSVAIDASHCPDWENFIYTRDIATHIPSYTGLEVEVGEIKGQGVISTVAEAEFFIGGLNSWGIFPDYLAISNGSKHGTYDSSKGESEGIDLKRTKEIADAISKYGTVIAQHGISGTPLEKVGLFKDYGIYKGNVGTLWQNIVFGLKMDEESGNAVIKDGSYQKDPDKGVPAEIWEKLIKAGDSKGMSRSDGNYKKLNIEFGDEIMKMDKKYRDRIIEETVLWAKKFFKAFNCEGTATGVKEYMLEKGDYHSAPERKIIAGRKDYTPQTAPAGEAGTGDFSD